MKEERKAILVGLGAVIGITLATVVLKRFFDNMATSEALSCIFFAIGMLFLVALLMIEYFDYRAREKTRWN